MSRGNYSIKKLILLQLLTTPTTAPDFDQVEAEDEETAQIEKLGENKGKQNK